VSFTSVPAVSLQALNALSSLLDQVLKDTAPSSKAQVPNASAEAVHRLLTIVWNQCSRSRGLRTQAVDRWAEALNA
jgi:hypothetical protein